MRILGVAARDLDRPEMRPLIAAHLLVVPLALLVGYWIGHNSWKMLLQLVAVLLFGFIVLRLQKQVWLLIVFGWGLTGQLLVLPLPFAVRDLVIILAFCAYVAYRVISHRNVRAGWSLLDILLAVHLGFVVFDYMLHPVGFYALGSDVIGARPYLTITLAVVGYWVLVHLPDSVKQVSRIPYYFLATEALLGGLSLLMYVFPSLVPYVYIFYNGIDPSAYVASFRNAQEYQRLKGFAPLGLSIILLLCSYYPPTTLFNPRRGRFYAMVFSAFCTLASGFRSSLLWFVAALGMGGWLHRRWQELAVGMVVCVVFLGALVAGQGRFYELPRTVQRTLCFLPGQWEFEVTNEAEGSSEWRFQLWKDIIERGLIKDWWFGDGFGAKVADLAALGSSRSASASTDFVLETGGYHSGPLTTIRYVGIIGLLLLYMLSITGAIYAYKTVQRCRGTPLFPVAVFMAIQLIWNPVHFTFVFGSYNGYLPDLIIQLGILRLLMRFCDQGLVVPATSSRPAPTSLLRTANASA